MKLDKNNWILSVVAALYILAALWSTSARLIRNLLCAHADSTAVIIFSYTNNAVNAVLLGACLALALGMAAAGCSANRKTAFHLGMSSAIVSFVYFLFYILFASSPSILYVDLVLIAASCGLECAMFAIFAAKETRLRISASAAAISAILCGGVLFTEILSSIMMVRSDNTLLWMNILALSGKSYIFCNVIRDISCGLFFFLAHSEDETTA